MIALFGRGVPVVAVAMIATVLLAGMAAGATAATNGSDRIDMGERLETEMFTESGEIDVDKSAESQPETWERVGPELDIGPESPRLNDALRQALVRPVLKGSIWAADIGFQLGYGMALTLGAKATELVINGGVALTVAGVFYRTMQRVRYATREVNT